MFDYFTSGLNSLWVSQDMSLLLDKHDLEQSDHDGVDTQDMCEVSRVNSLLDSENTLDKYPRLPETYFRGKWIKIYCPG